MKDECQRGCKLGHGVLRCTCGPPQQLRASCVLQEIVTGERPMRGQLRIPRVPEECPQVGR